jgi:hypothetical protein
MLARQSFLLLEPLLQPFFLMGIFEIGSHELFAWAGFELRSSSVARTTGISHWIAALKMIFGN